MSDWIVYRDRTENYASDTFQLINLATGAEIDYEVSEYRRGTPDNMEDVSDYFLVLRVGRNRTWLSRSYRSLDEVMHLMEKWKRRLEAVEYEDD